MNIIPLGMNCEIASYIVRNKLVKSKKEGRQTLLFDLMLTNYYGICHFFESKDSLNTFLDVNIVENSKNKGYRNKQDVFLFSDSAQAPYGDLIINQTLGFVYNHESPGNPSLHHIEKWTSTEMFSENNLEKFKVRYTKRYNSMITQIIQNNVIFVIGSYVWPSKLEKIIEKKFPDLTFKILVYMPTNNMADFLHNLMKRFPNEYKTIKEKYDGSNLNQYKIGHEDGRIKYIVLNSLSHYKWNTQKKVC